MNKIGAKTIFITSILIVLTTLLSYGQDDYYKNNIWRMEINW